MKLYSELKSRNVLRVAVGYLAASWLLIEVVETIFPVFGLSDELIRTIIVILAIGFPLALILSWRYQWTPEGVKLDRDVDRSSPSSQHSGKKLDRVIIVVLTICLGYFAYDRFVLDPVRDAEIETAAEQRGRSQALVESYRESSIAVLPFVNRSSDAEQEYFSDGISEEILNLLSRNPRISVISRASSFSFKDTDVDIRTIASQLDVSLVLEGSVRRAGDKIRITAQLIDALSDTQVWSETYNRELKDVFGVQDEISASIVTEFSEKLGFEAGAAPRVIATTNTAAHEAYLRGRYVIVQRTLTGIEGAIREFEKAITLDPNYAQAHAELAIAIWLLTDYGDLDEAEALGRARPHVEKALALNPSLAEAHAAAGNLAILEHAPAKEIQGHFEKAIELNPSYSVAYHWLGNQYESAGLGQYEESFTATKRAVQLDPLSIPALKAYCIKLIERGRLAEADIVLQKLASVSPVAHAVLSGRRDSLDGEWANTILGVLNSGLLDPRNTKDMPQLMDTLAMIGLEQEAIATDPGRSADTLYRVGKYQEAFAVSEARLAENPASETTRAQVRFFRELLGIYSESAWQAREKSWQQDPAAFQVTDLSILIATRKHFDEERDVNDLLSAMKERARLRFEAGITNSGEADYIFGLAIFLEGNREEGLEAIQRSVEMGRFIHLKQDHLQSLYDDPGFAPILAIQESHQKRERRRLLEIVCRNNPYAAFWQPEPGTCENFVTIGND